MPLDTFHAVGLTYATDGDDAYVEGDLATRRCRQVAFARIDRSDIGSQEFVSGTCDEASAR